MVGAHRRALVLKSAGKLFRMGSDLPQTAGQQIRLVRDSVAEDALRAGRHLEDMSQMRMAVVGVAGC